MLFNKKIIITTSLVLAVAVTSWWLADVSETTSDQNALELEDHSVDYYIKNLRVKTMGTDGLPTRHLTSDLLKHFQDDDTTELSNPLLTVYDVDAKAAPWVVRAESGWVSSDASLVLLSGRVLIDREKTATSAAVHVVGSDMRVQPQQNYVETDKKINITSGESRIDSVGMHAWLKNPVRFKFLSNVRGYYAAK